MRHFFPLFLQIGFHSLADGLFFSIYYREHIELSIGSALLHSYILIGVCERARAFFVLATHNALAFMINDRLTGRWWGERAIYAKKAINFHNRLSTCRVASPQVDYYYLCFRLQCRLTSECTCDRPRTKKKSSNSISKSSAWSSMWLMHLQRFYFFVFLCVLHSIQTKIAFNCCLHTCILHFMCAVRVFATEMVELFFFLFVTFSMIFSLSLSLESIRHGVVMQRGDTMKRQMCTQFSVSVDSQRAESVPRTEWSRRRIFTKWKLFTPDSWKEVDLNGDR